MTKFQSILLVATVLAVTLVRVSDSGLIDSWKYTRFFRRLSTAEQRAVISLAIAYHDAPESADDMAVFPVNPIRPNNEEIPATLFNAMMNGDIPSNWMKNFVKWIRNNLKISEHSLNNYRHNFTEDLCTEDGSKCFTVSDVGQQCCPFG